MNTTIDQDDVADRDVAAAVVGPPSSVTVGIIGAGQLARMTQQAAVGLAVDIRVLGLARDAPAVRAGADYVLGDPNDLASLRLLADGCDVVTLDHELVPPEHLRALEADGVALAPRPAAALAGADKLHARRLMAARGLPLPAFDVVSTVADAERFAAQHGWPLVAKAATGGYDGRGVWTVPDAAAMARLLAELPVDIVIEPRLTLERELAVLVARSVTGESMVYPVVETVQRDGMCREVLAPAPIEAKLAGHAQSLALQIATAVGATGVLAVEFFLTPEGLVVNELALRPHNSGHYTIEGTTCSQFEQHLRAILGWPLGQSTLLAPAVATVNVIGPLDGSDPASRLRLALGIPGAHIHLYGKSPRAGRKLGHVTVCGRSLSGARETARLAVALLENG